MRTLVDAPFEAIVAPRGPTAPTVPHATEIQSPWTKSATEPTSAVRPSHTGIRNRTIVRSHSQLQTGVVLKGLIGLAVMIALTSSEHVWHDRTSPVARVNLALTAKALLKGVSGSASPSSAASLEAQSVIQQWFILPQVRGASTTTATMAPIRPLRIFPGP
jgi:hypothetical protein